MRLNRLLCETEPYLALWSNTGCTRIVRTAAVEEAILETVTDQPSASTRAMGRRSDVSQSMICRILKGESLHPFYFQRFQEFIEKNYYHHVDFTRCSLQQSPACLVFASFI